MRILALDASSARCGVAVVRDGVVLATCGHEQARGCDAILPDLVRQVAIQSGLALSDLDLIAATTGPGSFTGLRAALAIAHGLGLGLGVPVIGVSVADALRAETQTTRPVWVVLAARRGHVFLDRGGNVELYAENALPAPDMAIAVMGNAADQAVAFLLTQGCDVVSTGQAIPALASVAAVATTRLLCDPATMPAQPLYVEPARVTMSELR